MNNLIKCTHCGKEIEISQALRHQIEEQVLSVERSKHKEELEVIRKEAEEKARQKILDEVDLKLKDAENEKKELREQNKMMQEQLLELNKLIRELRNKDEQRELEMQKKIQAEQEKIKEEIVKQYSSEYKLKELEKEKVISDLRKALEDAQRKANQGSQQLQGEVQELDLEENLKETFPQDDILPVGKGVTGADIQQIVKSKNGRICGVILWESKRTKAWSDEWVEKLKADMRSEKASAGIIISSVLPKDIENGIGFKNGIAVCSYPFAIPVAKMLRDKLIEVAYQKFLSQNKDNKSEMIYEYITGHEFRQQVEALAEVYNEQVIQITKERAAFERIWKSREQQARKILISSANIYGSMQGIVGGSMPQIKALDVLELEAPGK